jgi:AmmeMemoRadiSam system protein B
MDHPRLRYGLEILPVEHQGQRMMMLRDRLGYSEAPLLIAPQVANLLMHMNGKNSLRDLQAHYMRVTGELLFLDHIEEVLKMLDEHLFLENERFIQVAAQEVARFQQDPVRRMHLAGKSYPEEPQVLQHQIETFLNEAECPATSVEGPQGRLRKLLGLAVPHIDIQAGGTCFAHAYKALCRASAPETWVILGTGHEPVDNYFTVTQKDFETPLGLMSCDKEYCGELLERAPRDLRASEYNHRREHSVEFQTVFLSFVQPEARIVPILCSFSLEDWKADQAYIDEVASLMSKLAQQRQDRRVGFLASVDLAHIGPRYGDRFSPHPGTITEHLASDRGLLESLEKCDAAEFIKKIDHEHNYRRICGVAPLYVLSKILEGRAHGELLKHTYTTVDHQNSFVTFASMAFYEA